jgi:hypothetical protein
MIGFSTPEPNAHREAIEIPDRFKHLATSTVRSNLLSVKGYRPYCGMDACFPRASYFDGSQFVCRCGWRSGFPKEFIDAYYSIWEKSHA